jgi:hypothetical protein
VIQVVFNGEPGIAEKRKPPAQIKNGRISGNKARPEEDVKCRKSFGLKVKTENLREVCPMSQKGIHGRSLRKRECIGSIQVK